MTLSLVPMSSSYVREGGDHEAAAGITPLAMLGGTSQVNTGRKAGRDHG